MVSTQEVHLVDLPELGITTIMNRYIAQLVRTRLRFLWNNDPVLSQQDLCSDIQAKAISAARRAEAKGYDALHRSHSIRIAIVNYCNNIATQRSRTARNPLQRVRRARRYRDAWLVDTKADEVVPVAVSTEARHRRGEYVLTKLPDGSRQYRHARRLYTTEGEARRGLEAWRDGQDGRRASMIDLAVDHDDFYPVLHSLDAPIKDPEGGTWHEMLAGQVDQSPAIDFASVQHPRVRQCLDLLLRRPDDPVFANFCRRQGDEDPAAMSDAALLRRAMQFCGTDLSEMRSVLRRFRS